MTNDMIDKTKKEITNSKAFKWLKEDDFSKDPIILAITETMIQDQAESELERRLTQKELYRIKELFFECDDALGENLDNLIAEAIETVLDKDGEYDWDDFDKAYEEEYGRKSKQKQV